LLTIALNHYESTQAARPLLLRRLQDLAAGQLDDPALLAVLGMTLAVGRPPAAPGAEIAACAARSWEPELGSVVPGCTGNALLFAGRLEDAAMMYDRVVGEARARGWRLTLGWASALRANVMLHQGRLREAEEDARLGFDLTTARSAGGALAGPVRACAHLLETLLALGETRQAEEALARRGPVDRYPATYARSLLLGARGRLRLLCGRPGEALDDALASAPPPSGTNPACRPWRSDAARALRVLGRADERPVLLPRSCSWPGRSARRARSRWRCGRWRPARRVRPRSRCYARRPSSPGYLRNGSSTPTRWSSWARRCGATSSVSPAVNR
jgi:hypothetical protein